jgi:hypothetical protein
MRSVLAALVTIASVASPALADEGPLLPAGSYVDGDLADVSLIGAGGQVYERDAQSATPRWVRRSPGGFSADITAATRVGGKAPQLVIAGKAAPLFRWQNAAWTAMPVGQKGKTVLGTGPVACVAIGRQIFVWKNEKMLRVGTAPGPVVGVWAASEKDVRIVTDKAVLRLRGKVFAPMSLGNPTFANGPLIGGTRPLLVAGSKIVDIDRGRSTDLGAPILRAASVSSGKTNAYAAVVLQSSDNKIQVKLLTYAGTAPVTVAELPSPTSAAATTNAVLVDHHGRVLLTPSVGSPWLFQDGAWQPVVVESELSQAKSGPGPAFTQ